MKRILLSLAAFIISPAVCLAAMPSTPSPLAVQSPAVRPNHHTGFYVEGGIGTLAANVDTNDNLNYSGFTGGFGGIVASGFMFYPNFGLELDGTFSNLNASAEAYDAHGKKIGIKEANVDLIMVGPAIKFVATLGSRLMLNFKLGLNYASLSGDVKDPSVSGETVDSHTAIFPFDGIGISYAISPKFDVGASYQGFLLGVVNLGVLSGNLSYHFQ